MPSLLSMALVFVAMSIGAFVLEYGKRPLAAEDPDRAEAPEIAP